jgi:hypothetical protein
MVVWEDFKARSQEHLWIPTLLLAKESCVLFLMEGGFGKSGKMERILLCLEKVTEATICIPCTARFVSLGSLEKRFSTA